MNFNMERDDVIRDIHKKYYTGSSREDTLVKIKDGFLAEVAERFGWTEQQAYIATEFLFRPPNYN